MVKLLNYYSKCGIIIQMYFTIAVYIVVKITLLLNISSAD